MWTSLKGFEIAGEDKVFYPAFAEIETKTARLAVSSGNVLIPLPCGMRIRIMWKQVFSVFMASLRRLSGRITGKSR